MEKFKGGTQSSCTPSCIDPTVHISHSYGTFVITHGLWLILHCYEAQTLFRFPQLLPTAHFLFQDPIRDVAYPLVIVSP